MLSAGRIQKFSFPCNSPIIFIKKKNKNNPLRLVINYYGLNNITILIHYLIPLINKLQGRLIRVKYFIKINVKIGFYFIRMAEKKEWKTAFHY